MFEKFINFFKAAIEFIQKYYAIFKLVIAVLKELSKLSKTEIDDKVIEFLEKRMQQIEPK